MGRHLDKRTTGRANNREDAARRRGACEPQHAMSPSKRTAEPHLVREPGSTTLPRSGGLPEGAPAAATVVTTPRLAAAES